MCLCIPTYMLASSLIDGGMNWWQAVLTVFLGNLIVLVPMVLNGHAGAMYGVPFPVFARASFGLKGANIPALLRAIVACGWFGIQTWIGGFALYQIVHVWVPGIADLPAVFPTSFGLATGPAITFFLFWLLNMYVVYLGIESIRKLLLFKAVFLPFAALALLVWALVAAKGLGPILAQPSKFKSTEEFWTFFFPALTGMVGFWVTLSLNIPDFTRYARSQKSQMLGQALGLPLTMTGFAFIGVAVTSATLLIYGQAIPNPVDLMARFNNVAIILFATAVIFAAQLTTNMAANVVSPSNDFSNLNPKLISYVTGGLITAIIGIVMMPWKLMASMGAYIFTWLIGYSGLMGAIAGVLICDYWVLRNQRLSLADLFNTKGIYSYANGINWRAMITLFFAIAPVVPGFVRAATTPGGQVADPSFFDTMYTYAWFVTFGLGFVIYYVLMSGQIRREITATQFTGG